MYMERLNYNHALTAFEDGIIEAFNKLLSHQYTAQTSRNSIIITTTKNINNRLIDNSNPLHPKNVVDNYSYIRLKKCDDNIYISSYGDVLYRLHNNRLAVMSLMLDMENGGRISSVFRIDNLRPIMVLQCLNECRTIDLVMQCFIDIYYNAGIPALTSDNITDTFVSMCNTNSQIRIVPYSYGYDFAVNYINKMLLTDSISSRIR